MQGVIVTSDLSRGDTGGLLAAAEAEKKRVSVSSAASRQQPPLCPHLDAEEPPAVPSDGGRQSLQQRGSILQEGK